jgi:hypothetical protein
MSALNLGQVIAGAVSVGISFGVNFALRPEFDTHYAAAEYAQNTGTLNLSRRGGNFEVPLMTTHITTCDVERVGRHYKIRELTLRAAAVGGGPARLELFADLSAVGGDVAGGARDPSVLLQAELPLMQRGRLGARRSFLVMDGSLQSGIIAGSLMLTDVVQVSGGATPEYRAEGRLELQVETEHGVDMVTGRWSGRVAWDATTGT